MAEGYSVEAVLSAVDKSFTSGFKNAINSVENFQSRVNSSMSAVGKTLTIAGTAITAIGVKSLASFGKFQASLNKAAVTAGGTAKDIDKLADVANRMGAELPISAQDAADAMVEMAQAGADVKTIIKIFPAIAQAATAAGADLQSTASVVQQAMNIWGKSIGSSAQAAAVFTTAANVSNASIEDMQQVMADVGATANQMGMSLQDMATYVGLLTNKGIPAAQAAQNLNFVLTRMIKPSKSAKDVMNELGISYFDAQGHMKPMNKILQQLNSKTTDLTDKQKANALTVLFGQSGYKVMANLMDSVADTSGNVSTSYDAMSKAIKGASSSAEVATKVLADQAAEMQKNIGSKIEQVGGNWEALSNKAYQASAGVNGAILDMINSALNWATVSKSSSAEAIRSFVGMMPAIGASVTAIGTFSAAVGNMGNLFNNVKGAVMGLFSPVSLALAGIIALAAGFVLMYKNSAQLRSAIAGIGKAFSSVFGPAIQAAQKTIGGLKGKITEITTAIGDKLASVINSVDWQGFAQGVSAAFSMIGSAINAAITFFDKIVGAAKRVIGSFLPIQSASKKLGQTLSGISGKAIGTATTFGVLGLAAVGIAGKFILPLKSLTSFKKAAATAGSGSLESASQIASMGIKAAGIGIGIGAATAGIGLFAEGVAKLADTGTAGLVALAAMTASITILAVTFSLLGSSLNAAIPGMVALSAVMLSAGAAVTLFGAGIALIGTGINLATQGIMRLAETIGVLAANLGAIVPVMTMVGIGFASMIAGFVIALVNTIPQVITSILQMMVSIGTTIVAYLPQLIALGIQIIMQIVQGISVTVIQVATVILQMMVSIGTVIITYLPQLLALGTRIIVQLLQGIATAIPQIVPAAVNVIVSFIAGLTSALPQILPAGVKFITTLLNGIAQSIPQLMAAAVNVIVSFIKGLTSAMSRIIPVAAQAIATFINGIANNLGKIIDAAVNLIVKFIDGLTKSIPRIIRSGVDAIVAFINGVANNLGKIINAAVNLIGKFISGLVNAIPRIVDNGRSAVMKFVQGVGYAIGRALTSGGDLIKHFISGILEGLSGSKDAGHSNGTAVLNGVQGIDLFSAGSKIIGGFLSGLKSKFEAVKSFVGGIAGWIKDHKGPISYDKRLLIPAGNAIMNGLNDGLIDNFKQVKATVNNVTDCLASTAFDVPAVNTTDFTRSLRAINGAKAKSAVNVHMTMAEKNFQSENNRLLKAIAAKSSDVYLDGDALVGGTVDRYNSALGGRFSNESRWSRG